MLNIYNQETGSSIHSRKKRDIKDLKNYRPISLLSILYKLFTKVLTNCVTNILDFKQPREHAGFKSSFSTTDHLHVINQIIQKHEEYRQSLCLDFIDYEKAFDSIEIPAVLEALVNQGVHSSYINIINTGNLNHQTPPRQQQDRYR